MNDFFRIDWRVGGFLCLVCTPTFLCSLSDHAKGIHNNMIPPAVREQPGVHKEPFLLGVEAVTRAQLYRAAGKMAPTGSLTIGLVTNQTGKDQQGRRTIDILRKKGAHIARIFVPEHGLSGTIKASHDVANSVDEKTGIPVVSLFGNGSGKALDAAHLKDLDLLVFELQDSGMRHYTYISTLYLVMQAAALYDKPLMILDRPNPLKHPMEGPLVEPALQSFISIASIPLRHGMTIGELARYFNMHVLETPVKLSVAIMQHYNRLQGLPGQLPAQLSPYLKNKSACYGYSFLGLLGEVRPFSTGLGTDYAMRCVALPETVHVPRSFWSDLSIRLRKIGLHSRSLTFYSEHKKISYNGLLFELSDPAFFSSFQVLMTILTFVHKARVPLIFSAGFDKAVGTAQLREYVQGDVSREVFARHINVQLHDFREKAKTSFLYSPLPKIVLFAEKE